MNGSPAVSVVLCTFNRARQLEGALQALVGQQPGAPPHEIIVVDNNSSDDTRRVVEQFAGHGVRYDHEPMQGLAAARNTGIIRARADIIAFTDDDVRVDRAWIARIALTLTDHPEAGWVGGPVQPAWLAPPPPWLAAAGDAPLAILDYGPDPFVVSDARSVCLIGANLAVRRSVFETVGFFSTEVQRLRDGIGSTEDHDLQNRAFAAGLTGYYDPGIIVCADVPPERLSKAYHRRWHTGHGRFFARMRDPSFETSRAGVFFGVPAHVYRGAVTEAGAWLLSAMRGRLSAAFAHELRLRFLLAFARQRIAEAGR
jgi:glycosyltransferase involved in cell wall biosynthesis